MTAYVALLFAVNVGNRKVPSTELRALAADLGLAGARTHANSGNLVLSAGESGATGPGDVSHLLREALAGRYDLDVPVVTLTTAHLARLVAANPFPVAARDDPAHVLLHVGERPVDAAGIARYDLASPGRERLAVVDGALYATYPDGIGTSKVTATALARAAGTPVTGRNWNTVTKLLEMARTAEKTPG